MINCAATNSGIEVTALNEIPDGAGRIFQLSIEQKKFSLLVLRSGDCCYGYANRCPHFGMPLSVSDSQLIFEPHLWVKCNVHYAKFRWHDGLCEAGECEGESLQQVPLEVRDGFIHIASATIDLFR